MQLLTIATQAALIGWLIFVLVLAGRMALRTLDARRRRRVFWRDLLRSSRAATADNPYTEQDAARGRPFDYTLDDPNRDRCDV